MKNDKVTKENQKNIDKAKEDARKREDKIAALYIETMRKKKARE